VSKAGLTKLKILQTWVAANGPLLGSKAAVFLQRPEVEEFRKMAPEVVEAAIASTPKLRDAVEEAYLLIGCSHRSPRKELCPHCTPVSQVVGRPGEVNFDSEALEHLHSLTNRNDVGFHDGQLEAIRELVEARRRVLVVQRTGWGKSAVYFIASRMLRDRGMGPTLLVSPLIALMDNQVQAAARMGLRAAVVNSTNRDDWDDIRSRLDADQIDIVLISEQRLANPQFRDEWLPRIGSRVGLVVVDEVHCISDWGHDFRPHYRRIGRFLQRLPGGVPVIGCTATANDRVVADVVSQLGEGILTIRGQLAREGLRLEVHTDKRRADARLAWLAENVPRLSGTGIVYCLTRRDVELVADFLRNHGVACAEYVGGGSEKEVVEKTAALDAFLSDDLKCMVATSALGMGYDKPNVGFVIHYQMPQSPIAYYQQVGRAGRALDESYGILLCGSEDRDIQDWFISQAFPAEEEVDAILAALEDAEEAVRRGQLAARVNIATKRLDNLMIQLEVEGTVDKVGPGWTRTLKPWIYPRGRVGEVNAWRRQEQAAMEEYQRIDTCRMRFLRRQLDDGALVDCGVCDNCRGERFGADPAAAVLAEAGDRLLHDYVEIAPRKAWPPGLVEPSGRIPVEEQAESGWCLTRWGGAGWGPLVRRGKQDDGTFADELVDALAEMCVSRITPTPSWLTFIPSERHPDLVPSLARRLAERLSLPLVEAIQKARPTEPQKGMQNSASQFRNIWEAFVIDGTLEGACLLLDDVIDSRWTTAVAARELRLAGCERVVPIALASAGQ
jgi:ATP-dependent DNA helicase RecQ